MKKIFGVILISMLFYNPALNAQNCPGVSVEIIAVQHGNYNAYGARATLIQAYSEDVTVTGSIYDVEDHSINASFTVTVTAGNLTGETLDVLSSGPASSADITVNSVTPCPTEYAEEIAATYSLTNHTYTINLSPNNVDITNALAELFSLESPAIDSIKINDDDPSTLDSAAYLVLYVTATNRKSSMGLSLDKENDGNNHILYYLNNSAASVARAWECKTQTTCSECDGKRNWFLGAVKGCKCIEVGEANNDCKFNTSGSGFPWGPVLGFLGVLISILHAL